MELKDTVSGMLSSDYREREIAEYRQLNIRINKLAKMIGDCEEEKPEFVPVASLEQLYAQLYAMQSYQKILEWRMVKEGLL